ncbi:hypothetical protein BDN72DRAFT_97877 [Pluteus cervinus]|uniref:Uncharacterized protein n=1 Tax=Pluteus cervinus TaxID=181527 RepID=A0ACD3ANX8_9AGAR|nr:hypothetical protein BDN72DRAFT_97877 [Pluteus cervinus]
MHKCTCCVLVVAIIVQARSHYAPCHQLQRQPDFPSHTQLRLTHVVVTCRHARQSKCYNVCETLYDSSSLLLVTTPPLTKEITYSTLSALPKNASDRLGIPLERVRVLQLNNEAVETPGLSISSTLFLLLSVSLYTTSEELMSRSSGTINLFRRFFVVSAHPAPTIVERAGHDRH